MTQLVFWMNRKIVSFLQPEPDQACSFIKKCVCILFGHSMSSLMALSQERYIVVVVEASHNHKQGSESKDMIEDKATRNMP